MTRSLPRIPAQRGFALLGLVALLVAGVLYLLVSNLSPEFIRARRQLTTDQALAQAREALLGYAVRYRESNPDGSGALTQVYGFLPLPDLGTTRNNNTGCVDEGCDAANFSGNGVNVTVIGRFPWRALGTGPLRDSNGECLWYAVSGSHQRIQQSSPMNWDTLSQLDVVVADGTSAMQTAVAAKHDKPIAVIFSPGPVLPGQDRSASPTDNVAECGGNYNVANYLDPVVASDLGGITNYFSGSTNAAGDTATATANKSLSASGVVNRRSNGTLAAGDCSPNDTSTCAIAANDAGVTLTSELLFRTLRGSNYFRTDINAMLDRIGTCLRDQIAAGPGFTPTPLTGFTPPADKAVGRIPPSTCYDDAQNPLNYFGNYGDQVFVATPNTGTFTVTDTSTTPNTVSACGGALLFAGQRGTKNPVPTDSGESLVQLRYTAAVSATNLLDNTNWPPNYLEGVNLAGFTTTGALSFTGPSQFAQASGSQSASQDIVRCIPPGPSLAVVAPTVLAVPGNIQLANYAPATRTLTLGSAEISSNYGASAPALFACAWTPEVQAAGSGLRSYFRFRIRSVGEGFTLAVIDGDRNGTDVCGAARQHLGYSGNNGIAPYIQPPKLAIEFDTARECNGPYIDVNGHPACVFTEAGNPLSNGRNDPCYTSSCGGQGLDNSSHVAVVYWGYGAANATPPVVTQPQQDDNVHGFPWPPDTSVRPAPHNPYPVLPYVAPVGATPAPGVAPLDRMGVTDASQREFHARLEIVRSFTAPADPKNGVTGVQVQLWIEPQPAATISAMSFNAGSPPTLSVTTATNHPFATGDTVVIKDAVPAGYNGEYPVMVVDATHFTATLPMATADPGPYVSAIFWTSIPFATDRVTVTSANHGLNTGDSIAIAGALPREYNGTWVVTRIDADSYYFGLELSYNPGVLVPAIAAKKGLSPNAVALANTTRPMSLLDPTFKPLVSDTATIYDEQMGACAGSPPLCPNGQACGSDSMCYRPSFRNLRLGFTVGERASTSDTPRAQLIEITDRATTWLP